MKETEGKPVESVNDVSGSQESAIASVIGVRQRVTRTGAGHELVKVVDVATSSTPRRRVMHLNGHGRVGIDVADVQQHLVGQQ